MEAILAALNAYPIAHVILVAVASLVVIGQVVVVMTPSTEDDAAWEKIKAYPVLGQLIAALAAFAPIHKKD